MTVMNVLPENISMHRFAHFVDIPYKCTIKIFRGRGRGGGWGGGSSERCLKWGDGGH